MKEIPFFSERDYFTRWVKYHSSEWERLVTLGWTTAYIGAGPRSKNALMVKPKRKGNPARRRAKKHRRSERGFFPKRSIKTKRKKLTAYAKWKRDIYQLSRGVGNPRKRRNPSDIRIVYNKLLGGWYVVRGPHQTPLNGRFDSKAAAQAWLAAGRARRNPAAKYEYTVSYLATSGIRHKLKRKFKTAKDAHSFAHNLQVDFPERAAKVERIPRRNPATHIKHDPKSRGARHSYLFRQAARARRYLKKSGPFAVQVKRGTKWITLASFPFKASATDYGRALKTRYPGKSFRVFW